MILCDAADESGGKLYVLGGGWAVIRAPKIPVPMALAVKLSVPWDRSNRPFRVRAQLKDQDGDPVEIENVGPLFAEGDIEVGRPPGLKPGTPLDAPFVLKFGAPALDAGGYVWELEIDGTVMARAPFRVLEG